MLIINKCLFTVPIRAENKVKSERKLYDEKLREIALLAEKYGRLEIEQNKLMQSLSKLLH